MTFVMTEYQMHFFFNDEKQQQQQNHKKLNRKLYHNTKTHSDTMNLFGLCYRTNTISQNKTWMINP